VRAAALHALPAAPALAGRSLPAGEGRGAALAALWMARCDPDAANAAAGRALWEAAGAGLPPDFAAPLLQHLRSPHADVRAASAASLAEGVGEHPAAVGAALAGVLQLYGARPGREGRLGAGAALGALAPHLSSSDLSAALDFVLSTGLVDADAGVRAAMVAAGVAVVGAAGGAQVGAMLPLFESYLEEGGGGKGRGLGEDQLDLVREGAVVFLGTLARHLDPASPKVGAQSLAAAAAVVWVWGWVGVGRFSRVDGPARATFGVSVLTCATAG
jgi:hypothetical protein